MRFSNFHTHTNFSDGRNTVEETIQQALELNMEALGFSDHSYTEFDRSYCMAPENFTRYLDTIAEAKNRYADRIRLYAGLEVDYYSRVDTSRLDYWISSVHFIRKNGVYYPLDLSPELQQKCIDEAFSGDVLAFAGCYFDMVAELAERISPTFIGHFDLINKFSLMPVDQEEYRRIASEALRRTLKACPYVELNTGAMSRGWRKTPYPEDFLLETLLEAGGRVILSSDSHRKETLTYAFPESLDQLKKIGFTRIYHPEAGKMVPRDIELSGKKQ